jgi:hypothetical protein
LITKAIIQNVDYTGNKCLVRIPLFETASSKSEVEVTALINIPPGIFNNLYPGDIVFVGFEENAIEKPIILGKLYRGANFETNARGGNGNFDHLKVFTSAAIPSSTLFVYPEATAKFYQEYNTPKKLADKIMENTELINKLSEHHEMDMETLRLCIQPWNLEIDDGNLDANPSTAIDNITRTTNLTLEQAPALYNDTPTDWPLRVSPNFAKNVELEDQINTETNNKSNYYVKK